MVQLVGPGAHVMGAARFIREMARRGAFFNRIIRYNQALMSQIMQTIACNGLHPAEQRCCRWLLMTHDRAGADEFAFTHEFLATMLGVRRPTVTLIAATLQRRGLVEYGRGWVRIVDRPGLEAASCECYQTVKAQMQRMLPELGAALYLQPQLLLPVALRLGQRLSARAGAAVQSLRELLDHLLVEGRQIVRPA